ncbi:regulatory LuxR family protein [Saccharothrix australiensis]|uniref:Regulatory LuxR family protein n=2 Tax=Saccharothrix australiensis TaxID=2072 RepID=A0A495W7D3_9PSEU|nr:regulatory LuxR family protein [Saccharothrix australiensis]
MRTVKTLLVEREPALSELRRSLRSTAAGSGCCSVVEGPAGIGKTSLLRAAAEEAAALDLTVLEGRATELDSGVPLASLRAALGSLSHQAVSGPESAGNPLRLVDRLGDLIDRSAARRPLLIVLDDTHWADELSALVMRVLIPAVDSSPVMWLLARRPAFARGHAQDTADWLLREGALRLSLEPLSEQGVRTLCRRVLDAEPDASLLALAARTGGNPFLLDELLGTLLDTGQVTVEDGVATLTGDRLGDTFLSAVHHRLRDLSDEARQVLDAAAVLGKPFTVHEVSRLVGRSVPTVVRAVNEAIGAAILVAGQDVLRFRHDLVREALYHRLPGPVRHALHREAACVVRAEGATPTEVLEHVIRSAPPAAPPPRSDRGVPVPRADPDAPRHAPGPRAGGAAGGTAGRSTALAERAGAVPVPARPGAPAGLDADSGVDRLLGLAVALSAVGGTARPPAHPACPSAAGPRGAPANAGLLATHAHALLGSGDVVNADAVAASAVEAGVLTGDHAAVAVAAVARSTAARVTGNLTAALDHAASAVEASERTGEHPPARLPRLWRAAAHAAVDDFAAAERELARVTGDADPEGTWWPQPLWHRERADLRYAQGRLDDAAAEAETGFLACERLGVAPLGLPLLALSARIAVRRDDLAPARGYLRRADDLVGPGLTAHPEDLPFAKAVLRASLGQPAAALAAVAPVVERLPARVLLLTREPAAGPWLIRLALAADVPHVAGAVADALRGLAERNPDAASLRAAADQARALRVGDLKLFQQAVAGFRRASRPLALAAALVDLGTAELASGRRGGAVAALEEAARHYAECGAKRDLAAVQKVLRRLGAPRRCAAEPGGGDLGWSSLTQSELRVARLVAQGLTNREVAAKLHLSPHTVDSHLRHSFVKLGITSRVDLTRLVIAHDDGPGAAPSPPGAADSLTRQAEQHF